MNKVTWCLGIDTPTICEEAGALRAYFFSNSHLEVSDKCQRDFILSLSEFVKNYSYQEEENE